MTDHLASGSEQQAHGSGQHNSGQQGTGQHGMGQHSTRQPATDAATFWDRRYGEREQIWSGRVNPVLADIVTGLEVGSVLDLGCGEGADSVWLAGLGWQVTGVDVSQVALSRAEQAATAAGVKDRTTFLRCDLATDFPSGAYDLVSAQFLHSAVEFPRAEVLRRAAAAVVPGGRLLIVEHGAPPPWMTDHDHPTFQSAQQTYDDLQLAADQWRTDRLGTAEREAVGPDGQTGTMLDNIILVSRLA